LLLLYFLNEQIKNGKSKMQNIKKTENIRRRRIILILLLISLLPLSILGIGSWITFEGIIKNKSLDLERNFTEYHSYKINNYFEERLKLLEFILEDHSFDDLIDHNRLSNIFNSLNKSYPNSFVDLGIVNREGEHLAYIGPYSLFDKNYKNATWFNKVMESGSYISDVFLGFRQIPHCIIAMKGKNNSETLILRATINSEHFDSIVAATYLGASGEAFIINTYGIFQTNSATKKITAQSQITIPARFKGVKDKQVEVNGILKIRTISWLNNYQWLLIAQENKSEILMPIRKVLFNGMFFFIVSIFLVILATNLATRYLTR
jgi:two-component system, NtrC family, sensor kinase